MPSIRNWPWKNIGWTLAIFWGLGAGLMAMLQSPSKLDSEAHLKVMVLDMDAALRMGGSVDSTYSNAKVGGALLSKNINANSWNPDVARSYQQELMRRGWVKKSDDGNTITFCKDNMLARVNLFSEKDNSLGLPHEIYGFAMIYDATTKRLCN